MTDPDDLLAAIADASQAARPPAPGTDAERRRAAALIDQVGKLVSKEAAAARPAAAAVTSVEVLLGLDENAWRTFLGEAPTDALVACLVDASAAFRSRVVDALDDESRIWIKQNLTLLSQVTPALRDHARDQVLATANRMIAAGTIPQPGRRAPVADDPEAPEPAQAPPSPGPRVEVGFGGSGTPAAAPTRAAAGAPSSSDEVGPLASSAGVGLGAEMVFRRPQGDPTVALVAQVVEIARGKGPAELAALAGHLDQPLLAEGLRLIAQQTAPNDLATMLLAKQAELVEQASRQLDIMREGLLAIRFGEGVEEFKRRVER